MTTYLGHPHDSRIFQELADERDRQDAKWGDQSENSDMIWTAVLTEEVGESAQAALKAAFQGEPIGNLRSELVQVAAVAVAWIEAIDRRPTSAA